MEHPDAATRRRFRSTFDRLSQALASTEFDQHIRFLNFGYVALPDDPPPAIDLPPTFPNRESVWLLGELLRGIDLTGATIADVGAGRGGNAQVLVERFGVGHVSAIDLSYASLRFGASTAPRGVAFVQGDAERLPLAERALDAVVTVESASCYPDVLGFIDDAHRVLRPGGRLLFADIIDSWVLPALLRHLDLTGLPVGELRDITPNVLAARARRAERQRRALPIDGSLALDEWVGAEGSRLHALLAEGRCRYVLIQATAAADLGPGEADPAVAATVRSSAARFAAILDPRP